MINLVLLVSLCVGAVYGATKPNIVFFLIDDQDVMLNSLDAMIKTREIFSENGLKFSNGFSSNPVCCVSRSSMLLGRYVHNHLAHNNTVQGNCYSDEWIATEEEYTYNNYLHKAGYKTMYSGKYLNNYGKGSDGSGRTYETIPAGWDNWYTICGDAKFYDYTVSNNGDLESHADDYDTDYFPKLQKEKSIEFLDKMSQSEDDSPFLMVVGTPAAHKPWTPAPEYESIVDEEDMQAPRTLSWNYMSNSDKGVVLNSLGEMDDDLISQSDQIYRMRHAILLTVDDMISEIYNKIDEMGELDNTYFFYTSDHGFHVGQFGMTFGKRLLYETDIRVPFYIAGPSVKKGGITSAVALNIDIASTFIELALGKDSIPSNMDGRSLVDFFDMSEDEEIELANTKQAFIVEYNGESPPYDMQSQTYQQFMNQKSSNMMQKEGAEAMSPQQHRQLLEASTRPQNLWIMNCESQVTGLTGQNCDAWNNTYRCVRVIDGLKEETDTSLTSDDTTWESTMQSHVKGEMYCSYTCFDSGYVEADCMVDSVEAMGEYYDLDYDVWQTKNAMKDLSVSVKNEYESLLSSFLDCEGSTCRNLRSQESTWYLRESNDEKEFVHTASDNNSNNSHVERRMSLTSKIFIGLMFIVGISLAYVLYTRAMSKLVVSKIKYVKVATRPNYGGVNARTQAL